MMAKCNNDESKGKMRDRQRKIGDGLRGSIRRSLSVGTAARAGAVKRRASAGVRKMESLCAEDSM